MQTIEKKYPNDIKNIQDNILKNAQKCIFYHTVYRSAVNGYAYGHSDFNGTICLFRMDYRGPVQCFQK